MDYKGYRGEDFKLPEGFARRRYLLQPLGRVMMTTTVLAAFAGVIKLITFSFGLFFGLYLLFLLGWIAYIVGESYNTRLDKSE